MWLWLSWSCGCGRRGAVIIVCGMDIVDVVVVVDVAWSSVLVVVRGIDDDDVWWLMSTWRRRSGVVAVTMRHSRMALMWLWLFMIYRSGCPWRGCRRRAVVDINVAWCLTWHSA